MAPAYEPRMEKTSIPGFAREQQVIDELAAKKIPARGVVERQRGERIHDAPAPRIAAIEGLDAENRHDDFRRDAELALRALERIRVRAPEPLARLDAAVVDEDRAVRIPRPPVHRRRGLNRIQDRGLAARPREHVVELALHETMTLDHLADEGAHFGA